LRYAILFSGITERRNLNGLEFCYRILLEQFGFAAENVYVLIGDGSLQTADESVEDRRHALWPGDGTKYRLKVTGQGNRHSLIDVLLTLKSRLTTDDLLFINTTGHGGNYGDGRGPFLVTHPRRARYWVDEFCSDLAQLPLHRSLVVLMAQCFSGGFNEPILQASPATQTYVASASDRHSHAMDGDTDWDSFERNWLAALAQRDVNGAIPSRQLSLPRRRVVTVAEAFHYATNSRFRHLSDAPAFAAQPESAATITLSEDALVG